MNEGFSHLETLLVLFMIAILSALSFPYFKQFFAEKQDDLLKSKLLDAIYFAHHAAEERRVPISMCQANKEMLCNDGPSDRLLIFVDETEDGHIKNKKEILLNLQMNWRGGELHSRTYPHHRDFMHFSPATLTGSDNGTFWFCHQQEAHPVWAITLSRSGKIRELSANQDHIIKDSHGKPLVCR